MNINIALHSLIFCQSETQLDKFPVHERLSRRAIEQELVGDSGRLPVTHIAFEELRHRIRLKLSLGERTAVFVGDLSVAERQQLSLVGHEQGASVVELATDDSIQYTKSLIIETLQDNWDGITVVGDVHGDRPAMLDALAWAQFRHHFVWFLGDIIDYGREPLECMTIAYDAVMRGTAAMILGNHERKIARWLTQRETGKSTRIRINESNRITTDALERLSAPQRLHWIGQFRGLLAHTSLLSQMANVTLLHAAAHPSLWTGSPDNNAVETFALYGEADHRGADFRQSYRWVDRVPKGKLVFVGHSILHEYPMVRTGKSGGEVVFLDTGAGKGGHLSSADLRFTETGLRLECFRRY